MSPEKRVSVIIKQEETVFQSWAKDLFSLAVLAVLIYVSIGSTFWTLVTALMFIFFVGLKVAAINSKSLNVFTDKKQAIKYLESKINEEGK